MSKKINKWLEKIHTRLKKDEIELFTAETSIKFNCKIYRVIAYYQDDRCCLVVFDGNTKQVGDTEKEFLIEKNRIEILSLFKYFKSSR